MFEDYYYNDQQLQGLLDSIGYSTPSAEPIMYGDPMAGATPIMDTYQQAAVEPMTQEAAPAEAPFDLSKLDFSGIDLSGLNNLYGMNFASNFGGGAMGGIYPNDPNLQYINAPTSNKGNPTSPSGNVFTMTPDQKVRLVDLRTNTVVFEGTGYDAAREATRLGQNLTDTLGRKAEYNIQTANPAGEYTTVANEKKNKSTLGTIADVVGTVAPLALGFVPGFGQLSLLAKVAAAAGTGGLGAALKGDDILKGALLGGATAGIASGTGLDKALGGVLGNVGKGAVQGATQGVTQGLGNAGGDIVVTALSKLAQGAGSAAANALVSNVGKAGLSEITGYKTPAEQYAQQQTPAASNAVNGVDPVTGEIVVSKYRPINPTGGFDPVAIAAATGLPVGSILDSLGPLNPPSADPALMEPEVLPNDIVVNAPQSVAPPPPIPGFETAIPATIPGALSAAQTAGTPPGKGGVLGTGLSISQLLSLGSIGGGLLQDLLAGGGGDTGAGAPYVSPFGTGAGFAPRQDMRANPNITDYERYGFGPEAMFFQPQYTGLLPANAPAQQAPAGMTINPALMPIF